MATNRSKSAPKRETRTPVTFETAAQLCPHQGVAENVAQAFGLIVPEYDAIRTEHTTAVKRMAEAFEDSLNDKATAMHFQRRTPPCTGCTRRSGPVRSGASSFLTSGNRTGNCQTLPLISFAGRRPTLTRPISAPCQASGSSASACAASN